MNTNIIIRFLKYIPVGMLAVLLLGCERDLDDLSPVANPANPYVFIDGFSAGLNYAAFGGSVPTAFDVDNKVTWNNSAASMRFDVPNADDPNGLYAGGVFFTEAGRDLSGFTALTFWAKASQSATLNVVGFGNDLGASKYQTTISDLAVSTTWQKYYIPIPDPSRLTNERGMFFYSVAPAEGKGFSFWIDELKFEKLGTLAHGQFAIMGGQNQTETSFAGRTRTIGGSTAIINLPTGINQTLGIAISYFEFSSSDKSIATVNEDGEVSVIGGPGMAVITAEVNGVEATGSLTIQSLGDFPHAPTPTHPAENVISIFSDAYSNHPVDYYNGYWEPWQTTQSADFVENGDYILHYTNFNFVGIQFGSPPVDATTMTHFSMDIYIPHTLSSNAQFKIGLVDNSGPRGNFTRTITPEESQQWISLDIPLNSFAGLTTRTAIWQIIFEDVNENIPGFWADNIYFRK